MIERLFVSLPVQSELFVKHPKLSTSKISVYDKFVLWNSFLSCVEDNILMGQRKRIEDSTCLLTPNGSKQTKVKINFCLF